MIEALDVPATEPARGWVERLMASLPALEACARIEHRFGVLPLVDAFFDGNIGDIAEGKLGALGLFTPTPALRWGAAVEEDGGLLRGEVRIPETAADGTLVLARRDGGLRLAWIDHQAPGVERRGDRLVLNGAATDHVSRPVTLADLYPHLDAYAGVWALAASIAAGQGIRALRRAARISGFGASQLVATDVAELEIEAELIALAAGGDGGLAAAAAASRNLAAIAAKAAELRGLGVEVEETGRGLASFLGGPLMLENELGRTLGIPENPEGAAG